MGPIGLPEIIVILVIVLLLFGGKKLPELAKGLGRGLREFKNASRDIKQEVNDAVNDVDESVKK
jgi:sec-independent protein translocase protein TatA